MHQLDPDRAEPFNCPLCSTVTWAAPKVTTLRCRICDHVWLIRKLPLSNLPLDTWDHGPESE